jgi:hypothetical protein
MCCSLGRDSIYQSCEDLSWLLYSGLGLNSCPNAFFSAGIHLIEVLSTVSVATVSLWKWTMPHLYCNLHGPPHSLCFRRCRTQTLELVLKQAILLAKQCHICQAVLPVSSWTCSAIVVAALLSWIRFGDQRIRLYNILVWTGEDRLSTEDL